MNESLSTRSLPERPDECRHRWLIASPNGPTSEGVCRVCGARRDFRNSSDDYISDGTAGALRGSPLPLEIARP